MENQPCDRTENLRFVSFHGISLTSRVIRILTRAKQSHVAYMPPGDNLQLIEAWNHNGGYRNFWSYSDLHINHTDGTRYVVWELPVTQAEFDFCDEFYRELADERVGYDWPGVFSFRIPKLKPNRDGYFCSDGLINPIVECRRLTAINPKHVSPKFFVQLVQAMGGRKIIYGAVNADPFFL